MMTTAYPNLCQFYNTLVFSQVFSCKYHRRPLIQTRLYIECDNTSEGSCTVLKEEEDSVKSGERDRRSTVRSTQVFHFRKDTASLIGCSYEKLEQIISHFVPGRVCYFRRR